MTASIVKKIKAFFRQDNLPSVGLHGIYWPLAVGGAALDLWSKCAIFDWLPTLPQERYAVVPDYFQLILRENAGAAFSLAYGQRLFLTAIAAAAIVALLLGFLFGGVRRLITVVAMGCMTAGVIGNLYDRLFNEGLVRDFLDVFVGTYHWPTFNVADSMLCIGVGLLFVANFTAASARTHDSQQTAAH